VHLFRRGAVFWYRLRLPSDVAHKAAVNSVLRISLRTRCPREARSAAARVHATVMSEIERMRQSAEQSIHRIGRGTVVPVSKPVRNDLVREAEQAFYRAYADEEPHYVVYDALHRLDRLRGEADTSATRSPGKASVPSETADAPVAPSGINVDASTVARAANIAVDPVVVETPTTTRAREPGPGPELDLGAVADALLARQPYQGLKHPRRREPWTTFLDEFFESKKLSPSSAHDYRLAYAQLAKIAGQVPFAELESGHFALCIAEFVATGTARAGRKSIAEATQRKRISAYKSLMTWAKGKSLHREGHQALQGIVPLNVDHRETKRYKRRAFTPAELATLLAAPLFVGALSEDRLLRPGRLLYRGPKFWFVLLALCCGWRKGELEVAEVRDVRSEDGIWFLDLHHRTIELKSEFSPRRVPILPKLIELGFLDYVADRRREDGEVTPLFPIFDFSKFVNESLLKDLKIKDERTCLHSMRHNYVQAIDRSFLDRASDRFRFRLTGHTEGDARSRYEGVLSIEEARAFLAAFKPPASLDHLVSAPTKSRRRTATNRRRTRLAS
jgi:hypothetical protein